MVNKLKNLTLNKRFIMQLRESFSGHGFSSEDFSITENKVEENNIKLKIKYLYDDKYFFNADILIDTDHELFFSIRYSPGEYLSFAQEDDCDADTCVDLLRKWVITLRDEIKSAYIGQQINENTAKIKEIEKFIKQQFNQNKQEFFSREEGHKVKAKLDEFEHLFREKLDNAKAEKEQLHQEIVLLKEQVEALSKEMWTCAFTTKLLNWNYRDPAIIKQLGSVTMEVLPDEIKESLPPLLPGSEIVSSEK